MILAFLLIILSKEFHHLLWMEHVLYHVTVFRFLGESGAFNPIDLVLVAYLLLEK